MNKGPILSVNEVEKTFSKGKELFHVLKGVNFSILKGEKAGMVGVSGAGKTTLLQIIGTLDRPSRGEIIFEGKDLNSLRDDRLAEFRRRNIGFIFQSYNLLPEFNALENVTLPLLISGEKRAEASEKASLLLEKVGLEERRNHRIGELSGGEQQRVAIARAVARSPEMVLADEPTGNLDRQTGDRIVALLEEITAQRGATLLMVTHNEKLLSGFDRRFRIDDGRVVEEF